MVRCNSERYACPNGRHVSSHNEWQSLTDYLYKEAYGFGGSRADLEKSNTSTSIWIANDSPGSPGNGQSGNDSSGLSGLPGRARGEVSFSFAGDGAYWWSSQTR